MPFLNQSQRSSHRRSITQAGLSDSPNPSPNSVDDLTAHLEGHARWGLRIRLSSGGFYRRRGNPSKRWNRPDASEAGTALEKVTRAQRDDASPWVMENGFFVLARKSPLSCLCFCSSPLTAFVLPASMLTPRQFAFSLGLSWRRLSVRPGPSSASSCCRLAVRGRAGNWRRAGSYNQRLKGGQERPRPSHRLLAGSKTTATFVGLVRCRKLSTVKACNARWKRMSITSFCSPMRP